MHTPTTVVFLSSFFTLAVVHAVSMRLFLYWRFWWLDIPMHFFGGAIVAFGVFTVSRLSLPYVSLLTKSVWHVMAVVVCAMVIWEVFEFTARTISFVDYKLDTLSDIIIGFIGGLVGYYLAKRFESV